MKKKNYWDLLFPRLTIIITLFAMAVLATGIDWHDDGLPVLYVIAMLGYMIILAIAWVMISKERE